MGTDGDVVLTERRGRVLVVTLNRPHVRNAVNEAAAHGVAAAADLLDADDELRVGVLTGAGGTFCSGMDLKAFLTGEIPRIEGRGLAGIAITPPRKPLIAAVEGWALAGGCEIALACDMIVAARDARFGLPEVTRSLAAGGGGLLRLPERIPANLAMEHILTGDPFGAEAAAAWGLVNRLTEPGDALAEALVLAERIAANGPLAVQASKDVLVRGRYWSREERWARQAEFTESVLHSEDAKEGARAFAERRTPVWRGR
ncbi:crotonase/enoyl-CoA hydratase family protein [Pseudonocardia sp. NPDC049154]|uniref:crotonase/enoyl-CoA hydratase family protein n=1 Tax=Pseudonocardia sp. NPDC049154 TaxID=3155501 RepID=UPI0033E64601